MRLFPPWVPCQKGTFPPSTPWATTNTLTLSQLAAPFVNNLWLSGATPRVTAKIVRESRRDTAWPTGSCAERRVGEKTEATCAPTELRSVDATARTKVYEERVSEGLILDP